MIMNYIFQKKINNNHIMREITVANKKYMTIAVTVVCGSQLSAPAPVARGRWSARKSATAYISVR
jgi:hypothetical protein